MKDTLIFSEETKLLARFAKALGHPARIEILNYLAKQNTCFTGDIVEIMPLAQATVSQHLKALKEAGLICGTVQPPKVSYCIDQQNWIKAQTILWQLFENGCCKNQCTS